MKKRSSVLLRITLLLITTCVSLTTLYSAELFGPYASHQRLGRSLIITSNLEQRLRLTPYGDYIIRVQAVRAGEEFFSDDRYEMVESHLWPGALTILEDSVSLVVTTGVNNGAEVRIDKKNLGIVFRRSGAPVELLRHDPGFWWDDDTIHVSFAYDGNEHFAGLGHGYYGREDRIDRKGTIVERNYGTLHGQQAPLIVPFFLSGKGYGLFLNSTFPNRFNFGVGGRYQVSIAGDARMDYFMIIGPHFRDILDRYTQLTGRPRFFPKAALGLALSDKGNDHNSADPSDEQWWKKKISAHRLAGFPLDHIVNDNRWRAGGGQRCVSRFDWDLIRYPDPKEYKRWVSKNGLIVTLDFNRCIASRSEGWNPSFNIPEPDSIDFNDSAPDLTTSEVRSWFWNIFWKKSLDPSLKYPGDALWIDEFDEMGKAPFSMVMGNGRTWREMRNYWFFLIAKALVADGWDKDIAGAKRPFVWVRGMTAGGQRYATLWSGDIKPSYGDMMSQVRGLQSAGLSGFPFWGHDAGGFNNWEENHGPDDTMYRQWSMAFGSFTPFWKPHGIGASRWPLDRPIEVRTDAKIYSELRYRMMPYIYTYAHRSSESGIPIARAMIVDHQDDPMAWTSDLQYMWGDELLVAPNCTEGKDMSVWLPEGNWFDFWNDSVISGAQVVPYRSPVGKLPLFVKAGSIIPMGNYALSTTFLNPDSLTLHVYTGGDATFHLYEDDGVTERYKSRHEFRTTAITFQHRDLVLNVAAAQGTFENASKRRAVSIVYHGLQKQPCLTMNGRKLRSFRTIPDAKRAVQGAVWDPKKCMLTVFLKSSPVTEPLIISAIGDCQ